MRPVYIGLLAAALASGQGALNPQRTQIYTQIQGVRAGVSNGADPRLLERQVGGLANGFRSLGSGAQSNPELAAQDRQMIQDAGNALQSVEQLGSRDPGLRRALAGAYGAIGDYQARPEYSSYGYNPTPYYGRASGLTRGLMLSGSDKAIERDLERYALSMATWNAVNNRVWAGMNQGAQGQEEQYDTGPTPPARQPLRPPDLDPTNLSAAEKERWEELRMQFIAVSQKVADALRNLDNLTLRLRARRMEVNSIDLAASYRMQGFLEDAFSLLSRKEFDEGKAALTRADYERNRLRSVTGQ